MLRPRLLRSPPFSNSASEVCHEGRVDGYNKTDNRAGVQEEAGLAETGRVLSVGYEMNKIDVGKKWN